ncbi:hypothetical protein J8L85_05785 [Maribacter sp. MMG018]|uniref:hypothetical protein n=1 Tax=Maribacter sp. MMG018 TaxID=2822688 RepID=UPI001B3909BB|nr:hypothetical protein [Maribacter sp. MMG018]MBQ4913938.1 hypothetical protein [Maribacter sp. MMG018]
MKRSLIFTLTLTLVLLFSSCWGSHEKHKELHPSETPKKDYQERNDTLLKPNKPQKAPKGNAIDTLKPKMAGYLDSEEMLGSEERTTE